MAETKWIFHLIYQDWINTKTFLKFQTTILFRNINKKNFDCVMGCYSQNLKSPHHNKRNVPFKVTNIITFVIFGNKLSKRKSYKHGIYPIHVLYREKKKKKLNRNYYVA